MSAGAKELRTELELLRAIVDRWEGPIYIVTPDYRLRFINRRLIDRLGRDATGESCFRVLYDCNEPCPWCAQEVFRGETARNRLQQPADGRWYEVLHTPLPFADGSFGKITVIRESPDPSPPTKELPVFQMVVDRLSDAVFFHSPATGRISYVNDAACDALGFRREELLQMHVWDYSEVVTSPAVWQEKMAELATAGELTFESRHRRRDGWLDVEVKATAVQVGTERYVVSVARDITERKKVAARLLEERNKVEAIMEAIGDGITVQDRDFRILYQNEVQVARQGEHLGERCYRAYRKRDRPCGDCQTVTAFADGRIHRRQVTLETPLGTLHQEITACPLRDGSGKVVACVEVIRDVTEQKRIEQALHESNEKYRLLFSAESDAILTYDGETGEIHEVNDSACQLYGIARADFIGRRWFDLLAAAGDTAADGQYSAVHRRGDGTFFPVEFSAGTYQWRGRPMVVAVLRDIGERLRHERSREEVFSVLSHEMRTPLTAILGFAEYLLENAAADDPHREIHQLIAKESERMWVLIDNLLSLKRLLAGYGLEHPVKLAVPPMLREVVDSFRTPLARQRIEIDCATDLPAVLGEAVSIQQALKNLLGNAIKYSPLDSPIVLGAHAEEGSVLLWVHDEGPGIPADQQERIFERFYRVGGRKGPAGTGLGLALVREIAHAHGGHVWVESTPGAGSTFYVSLPIAD